MLTLKVEVDVGTPAKVALRKMFWLAQKLEVSLSDDNFNGSPLVMTPGWTVDGALAHRARLRAALGLPEETAE